MYLKSALKMFCDLNPENYEYRGDYSGRLMFGEVCPAVVVKNGISFLKMWVELSKFLEEIKFDDEECELMNPDSDDMGKDIIVYFPHAHGVQGMSLEKAYEILEQTYNKIKDSGEDKKDRLNQLKKILDTRELDMSDSAFLFNMVDDDDLIYGFGEAAATIMADAFKKMK